VGACGVRRAIWGGGGLVASAPVLNCHFCRSVNLADLSTFPYLTVNLTVLNCQLCRAQADTPEELYENDIIIGQEGMKWEKQVNIRHRESLD